MNILAVLKFSFVFKTVENDCLVCTNKHLLGEISIPTCQPCTTLDVLIVNNFSIELLRLKRNIFLVKTLSKSQ